MVTAMDMVPNKLNFGGTLAVSAILSFAISCNAQTTSFTPGITVGERYSSNALLENDPLSRSSWISSLGAGMALEHRGASTRLSIDYRLQKSIYSSIPDRNNTQRFLNSSLRSELVDNFFVVDARSTITRQNRSAFESTTSIESTEAEPNRVETRTISVTPSVRGRFGDLALFQARVTALDSRTANLLDARSKSVESFAALRSDPAKGGLGWVLDAHNQRIEGDRLGERKSSRGKLGLTFSPGTHLSFLANGGTERTDFAGGEDVSTSILGLGVQWTPQERTQLGFSTGRRFFGNEYAFALTHRFPLTAVRVAAMRDVTFLGSQAEAGSSSPLVGMLTDLLAASIPDPAARAAILQRRFEESNLPRIATLRGSSTSSRPILNQRFEATILGIGVRNLFSVSFGGRRQNSIENSGIDPLSAVENVRQRTVSGTWTYRLDPLTSMTYAFNFLHTEGLDLPSQNTRQRQNALTFISRLGPRMTANFGARRTQFDRLLVSSYSESSVFCNIDARY
jgi:uncharacterized protein (PEP-CTERM system associated)